MPCSLLLAALAQAAPVHLFPERHFAGPFEAGLAAGDLDGDGDVDLLLASEDGEVQAYLGDGRGDFAPTPSSSLGLAVERTVLLDVDGDGDLDAACVGPRSLWLLENDGSGAFTHARTVRTGVRAPIAVETADVDGDSLADLVIAGRQPAVGNAVVELRRSGAPGTFEHAEAVRFTDRIGGVAVMDVDGDGRAEIAVARVEAEEVALIGIVGASLAVEARVAAGDSALGPALGDADGDGLVDLVLVHGELLVALGDGAGAFPVQRRDGSSTATGCSAADLDGDGTVDLFVTRDDGALEVLRGHGTGTFGVAARLRVGESAEAPYVADFDGDGLLDIAALSGPEGRARIWRSLGPLAFAAPIDVHFGAPSAGLVALDLDGDGALDLASGGYAAGAATIQQRLGLVRVRRGEANFAFGATEAYLARSPVASIRSGDLDGDGDTDLALEGAAFISHVTLAWNATR